MELASLLIALAGLLLSLANSVALICHRRLKLCAECVSVIPRVDDSLFLDLILSNVSSLPVSVNTVEIVLRRGKIVPAKVVDHTVLENTVRSGGAPATRSYVRLASTLPAHLEPYTSQRLSLEFSRPGELIAQLRSLRRSPSARLRLRVSTSRGPLWLRVPARFVPGHIWVRDFR